MKVVDAQKTTMQRWKIGCLTVSAAVLAAGCAGGAGPGNTASSGGGTAEAGSASETATVTYFVGTGRKADATNDAIRKHFAEKSGVLLEPMITPTDSWKEKFNLLLASEDLPELSRIDWDTYNIYAAQGAFYPIKELVGKYPNLKDYVPEEVWKRFSVKGEIYGVPDVNTEGKSNLIIRKDWLDHLGLPVPKTLDDFYETMKAFTERDPDGNGKNDTIGYGNKNLMPFLGAFGVAQGFYSLEDGKVMTHMISDNYKQALQFVNKMYNNGYMDKEAFILKDEQVRDRFLRSGSGALTSSWAEGHILYQNYQFDRTNPEAVLLGIAPPVGPSGRSGLQASDPTAYVTVLSRNTKHAPSILKLLDYLVTDQGFTVSKLGLEGLHWKQENGRKTFNALTTREDLQGNKVEPNNIELYSMFMKPDLYPQVMFDSEEYAMKLAKENFIRAAENPLIRNLFLGINTPELAKGLAELSQFELDRQLKFILGEIPFERWSEYTEEWKRKGGEAIRQSLLKEYNERNGTNYEFKD